MVKLHTDQFCIRQVNYCNSFARENVQKQKNAKQSPHESEIWSNSLEYFVNYNLRVYVYFY